MQIPDYFAQKSVLNAKMLPPGPTTVLFVFSFLQTALLEFGINRSVHPLNRQRCDGDITVHHGVGIQIKVLGVAEDHHSLLADHVLAHGDEFVRIVRAALTGDADLTGILGDVDVVNAVEKIAEIKNMDISMVDEITTSNARKVFKI